MTNRLRSWGAHVPYVLILACLIIPAEGVFGQVSSVQAWVGLTEDLKPNPVAGTTERNSAPTFGATLLFGQTSGRLWGVSGSWSRFSHGLRHIDLLLNVRWLRSDRFHLDLQGGPSRASWTLTTFEGQERRSSLDWLIGPVAGTVVPLNDRLAIELAGVTQFRWSPQNNDYLRVGARIGFLLTPGG